jgi:sulfate-transporting ATPase
MTQFFGFSVLGLGSAAVYTLLALGVVLIYRGSGVVNFAQSAFALLSGYTYYELERRGYGIAVSLVAAVAVGTVLGLLTQWLVMRPLRNAAPIVRIIATLAILLAVEAGAALHYADIPALVPPIIPQHSWLLLGVHVPSDRIGLYAIAIVLTASLAWAKRRSLVGLATSAAAESERGAATLGWSPDVLATLNWCIGGALAGLAGALIGPITGGLQAEFLALLIVPTLAVALCGRFDSFWLVLAGATAIGVFQSLSLLYVHQTGAQDAVPFLLILIVLVFTGRSLPVRGHLTDKLPAIGTGRVRPVPWVLLAVVLGFLMVTVFSATWSSAFGVSFATSIVLLSLVVVTGYAGQLSLAQFVIAGMGAWVAGRLSATEQWPFLAVVVVGVLAAVPLGALFALPALRTRGVNLAILTLGLAVAVQRMLFENYNYTGGFDGTIVKPPKLFGLSINAVLYPDRYGVVTLGALILVLFGVGNLRRSAAGRRLIAIRTNERAAASLGISVVGGKVYAFALGSAIAALGGILLGFRSPNIVYDGYFGAVQSIQMLAYAVIGGVAFVTGPIAGGLLASGGIGTLFNPLFHSIDLWLPFIGACILVVIVILHPDGQVPVLVKTATKIGHTILRLLRLPGRWSRARNHDVERARTQIVAASEAPRSRVRAQEFAVEGLTIRYGGVTAVDSVSLRVKPGQIVGLIGPNGAGKTSLIDALTGFARPSAGTVRLGDRDITRMSAHKRVHLGLVRSWQSLELFEQISVLENLQIACDRRAWWENLRGLVWPGHASLTPLAAAAVHEFQAFRLQDEMAKHVTELSFSQRRVVATARAVAYGPSVLLLDEPTSGMSDVRRAELSRAVKRLADDWGIGLLVVDHDMPFVMEICDRIVVMDAGRKIADGTPDEVRNDQLVIDAYLRTSAASEEGSDEAPAAPLMLSVGASTPKTEDPPTGEPLLEARDLAVGYFDHPVVQGLSLAVHPGEIVAFLGANRAGKTTTLLGLAGEIEPMAGEVWWLGERVGKRVPLHNRARHGLGFVTDERSVFTKLTVDENLRVGRCDREWALDLFPELKTMLRRRAGLLSGGEQQMLGLGRALARQPKVLLVDEMSLGLAPIIVTRLLQALRQAADDQGVGVVLVEQHVQQALDVSDAVCVIAGGRMTLHGRVKDVGDQVAEAFLADVLGHVGENTVTTTISEASNA